MYHKKHVKLYVLFYYYYYNYCQQSYIVVISEFTIKVW